MSQTLDKREEMREHSLPSGTAHAPPVGPVPEGASRVGMMRPLRIRDFRLLWMGMSVSFLGDGFYLVAIAWETYTLSNIPTAFSMVSLAWSLPMVLFLLFGGVLSDRFERRYVMIAGDVVRFVAIVTMGVLALTGVIQLWHLIVLAAVYGIGQALFNPAFGAIVPDVVPKELLVEANSLDNFVRSVTERMAGPALGGFVIFAFGGGHTGSGAAFLVDSGTFVFSAFMLSLMRSRPVRPREDGISAFDEIKEGMRFARSRTWLWGTLVSSSLTLLFVLGPFEVLVPFLVKNKLGGSSADLGLVFTAGGVGALVAALVMSQVGLPKRHITFMYIGWGIGMALMLPYAFITEIWHAAILEFFAFGGFTAGIIVWGTLMHRLVPRDLLGRVTSLDWTVSTALLPLSFALSGPMSEWIGLETTFIWSGVLGSFATLGFLFLPGMRDTERNGALEGTSSGGSGGAR